MSNSVQPHRQQPTRLPHPWDSPGKNTGVGCHFLLQCIKVKSESEVAHSCPTLSDPMDCSLPGSSIHGIFQARVLAVNRSCKKREREREKWLCLCIKDVPDGRSVCPWNQGVGQAGFVSSAQLCSDNFLTLLLCLLPQEWQSCLAFPAAPSTSWCSPTSTPALLCSLIATGEFSNIQSLLELGWTGGGKIQVGFLLSLSLPSVWRPDKYPDSEMSKLASGMFL